MLGLPLTMQPETLSSQDCFQSFLPATSQAYQLPPAGSDITPAVPLRSDSTMDITTTSPLFSPRKS